MMRQNSGYDCIEMLRPFSLHCKRNHWIVQIIKCKFPIDPYLTLTLISRSLSSFSSTTPSAFVPWMQSSGYGASSLVSRSSCGVKSSLLSLRVSSPERYVAAVRVCHQNKKDVASSSGASGVEMR